MARHLESEIPAWAKAVSLPGKYALLTLLDQARREPAVFRTASDYFRRLAEAARGEARRGGREVPIALVLLDLVPEYLRHLDEFEWIRDALRDLFAWRAYRYFGQLKLGVRRGRPRSTDKDLLVGHVGALVHDGASVTDATRKTARAAGVSTDAVEKARERVRREHNPNAALDFAQAFGHRIPQARPARRSGREKA